MIHFTRLFSILTLGIASSVYAGSSMSLLVSANSKGEPAMDREHERTYVRSASIDARFALLSSSADNFPVPGQDEVYRKDLKTGELRLVSESGGKPFDRRYVFPKNMSADGSRIAFIASYIWPGSSECFLKDLNTGELKSIFATVNDDLVFCRVTNDGNFMVYLDPSLSTRRLVKVNLYTGVKSEIDLSDMGDPRDHPGQLNFDVSRDSTSIVYLAANGHMLLRTFNSPIVENISSSAHIELKKGQQLTNPSFSQTGRYVSFRFVDESYKSGLPEIRFFSDETIYTWDRSSSKLSKAAPQLESDIRETVSNYLKGNTDKVREIEYIDNVCYDDANSLMVYKYLTWNFYRASGDNLVTVHLRRFDTKTGFDSPIIDVPLDWMDSSWPAYSECTFFERGLLANFGATVKSDLFLPKQTYLIHY